MAKDKNEVFVIFSKDFSIDLLKKSVSRDII